MITIRQHAREQTAALLRRVAFQVSRASKVADTEAIHDLRVSIRRLSQCLRVFGHFFPARKTKKVRHGLKELMKLAAEVRNRDVALELLAGAGSLAAALEAQRAAAGRELRAELKAWLRRHTFRKWRSELGF